jgi:hypothetical protein
MFELQPAHLVAQCRATADIALANTVQRLHGIGRPARTLLWRHLRGAPVVCECEVEQHRANLKIRIASSDRCATTFDLRLGGTDLRINL